LKQTEEAKADYIHVDVMDGRFVPNLTIGPLVVEAVKRSTKVPLDVHLMIVEPERLIPDFVSAGADVVTVHQEACTHLHRVVHQIKELGAKVGVAINPATPVGTLEEVLQDLDLVLVMTVNPGFGGQQFIARSLEKIRKMRNLIDQHDVRAELEVDGGIKADNVAKLVAAGADVIVAGSAVYGAQMDIRAAMEAMRKGIALAPMRW
jgi:ribulose-phosphate 3-epimerase